MCLKDWKFMVYACFLWGYGWRLARTGQPTFQHKSQRKHVHADGLPLAHAAILAVTDWYRVGLWWITAFRLCHWSVQSVRLHHALRKLPEAKDILYFNPSFIFILEAKQNKLKNKNSDLCYRWEKQCCKWFLVPLVYLSTLQLVKCHFKRTHQGVKTV